MNPPVSVGIGYRRELHDDLFASSPGSVDFVELAPENYAGVGGAWQRRLQQVQDRWPVITHGLAMSLGSPDPLNSVHLEATAGFVEAVGSPHHSDHLCASGAHGIHLHELLPVPMTHDSAAAVAQKIRDAQSNLSVPFAIENVSAYARLPDDSLSEADFVSEVVAKADCKLLLDVNNIYVNAINFGLNPMDELRRFPLDATVQIHIAGFRQEADDLLIDTHGSPVADGVWPLLEEALRHTGPVPVLLERDQQFPNDFQELLDDLNRIRAIGARVFSTSRVAG